MSNEQNTYTYRNGEKIPLRKEPDQFVVRALPDVLSSAGITNAEQVSASSSRVTVSPRELEPSMGRARFIAPTHHAYKVADTGDEFLVTDRVLVTFRQPLPPDQLDAFAGRYGLIRKEQYSDRDYLFQLTDHTGMNPVKLVVKLMEEEPLVAIAEHDLNRRMNTYEFTPPSDPNYTRQWHLHPRMIDPDVAPQSCSQCEDAWRVLGSFGSSDVVVGVTDDGCKLDHHDFNSPGKFAGWAYFVGERLVTHTDIDVDPSRMYQAGANHGTSCAGVIAGEADAILTVGAAPACRLLPIKWESSGPFLLISDSKLMKALNYIADKVDVLSNSWGTAPRNTVSLQVLNRVKALAQTGGRRGRGIVFLWAAGNENCPIQHTSNVDIPYTDGWDRRPDNSFVWVGVEKSRLFQNNLADVPGVMHVAALSSVAQRSHYSNYGTGIDICAPSSNSHEYHRLTVRGLGITTTTGSADGTTASFGGTSSATPLVAGIAALTISANPDLAGTDIISILKRTASKDLRMEGYPRTAPAVFDPNTDWDVSPVAPFNHGEFAVTEGTDGSWSPWFGHGRVDAAAAVAEATRRRGPEPQKTFLRSATPALAIPDNEASGARSTITFSEAASLSALKINVELTHTYIGDLRLTLIAPSGTSVVLHDRNGGSADNLQRSFDLGSTPALAMLNGQSILGSWVLLVQDLAPSDVGVLNKWELEIAARAGAMVEIQESPGAAIPDNDPNGLARILTILDRGEVKDVSVSLDITHSYIGDLQISLISPAGTKVDLHRRAGGSADNLITTYTSGNTPGLRVLHNQAIEGAWKLIVADLEAQDRGKLNHWGLRIKR